MSVSIRGIGLSLPAHRMTQEEAAELGREVICRTEPQRRVLSALYRKSGVDTRHTVLPHTLARNWLPEFSGGEQQRPITLGPSTAERMRYFAELAPPLAQSAASTALQEAQLSASQISHLITVSCTGFTAPGLDVALLSGLSLQPTTQRLQIGFMGCHGAINGLRAAQAVAESDRRARVLLCAVELCSLHYRFNWEPERLVANALFADAAAALVAGGEMEQRGWSLRATGSCLLPQSQQAMTWRIGDHGFEMTLDASVPELIQRHLRTWLMEWLAGHDLELGSVGSWAIHPGGPRILAAVEESLGLSPEATAISRQILSQCGNMSSPTVLFIVQRLREQAAPLPCVALGFGPGLFAEAALFV